MTRQYVDDNSIFIKFIFIKYNTYKKSGKKYTKMLTVQLLGGENIGIFILFSRI